MRSTRQFSITLPNEMAEVVKAKVAAGEYATESESSAMVCARCWLATAPWKPGCAIR
ncbi:ribbon-helix-helix domain-containing protein [Lysobacter sp. D1-1-M9]|uniref:ribbon-helix-helix domain-containing protein n=1 Tax=Novilysobacter longmucuonensis TaxID=3098603 RepID=UPI0039839A2E